VAHLVVLGALVAGHVVLAGQEDAVALGQLADLALVALLLLGLAVVLVQLALVGQAAAQLELRAVLQRVPLALDPLRGQSDPGPWLVHSYPLVVPRSSMYHTPSMAKTVEWMLLRCWSSGKLISLVFLRPTLDLPLTAVCTKVSPRLGPSTTLRAMVLALVRSTRNWLEPISMTWS